MRRRFSPTRFGVAWVAAVVPASLQFSRLAFGRGVAVWLAVSTIVVLAAASRSVMAGAIAVVGDAALMVAVSGFADPKLVAVVSAGALVVSSAAAGVVALPSVGPSIVLAVPLVAADVLLVAVPGARIPAAALGVGVLLVGVAAAAPRRWAAVERATAPATVRVARLVRWAARQPPRAFRALGAVVQRMVLLVIFVVAVVGPWLVTRVLRINPLWAPTRAGSRWVPREPVVALRTGSQWFVDTGSRWRVRRHRVVNLVLVAALATVLVAGVMWIAPSTSTPVATRPNDFKSQDEVKPNAVAAEMSRQPWWPAYEAAFKDVFGKTHFDQYAGIELPEFTSQYVNEHDGVRTSWQPPPDACAIPLDVWAFGGSTLYGTGQRDEFTIASELAKIAWSHHVELHIQNRGIPADVSWTEQHRLERALVVEPTAPDLVLFYDGFNDSRAIESVFMTGRNVTHEFLTVNDHDLLPLLTRLNSETRDGKEVYVAQPVDLHARPLDPEHFDPANERIVRDAVEFQYEKSHELSVDFLAPHKIPMMRFYQPTRATRNPARDGDFPTNLVNQNRAAEIRQRLPKGVVDIADALDPVTTPVYFDDVHTSEAANPVIAERMWTALAPLAKMATRVKGHGCS